MDRRNGGDPLAPPRPPKLLPRVHRPKAPEPATMSAPPTPVQHQLQQQHQQQQQQQLCTNSHSSSRTISSNNNSSRLNSTIANSRNSNNNNSSNSSSNTTHLTTPLLQLHHHQQQQQHPHNTVSLNRNNSNISSASSTSSVATTVSSVNSFTRRRPPPPPLAIATSSSPILPLLGASLNLNLINNNNSIEPVPVSPVTLAAPRPESERLTNEYVDTPFRTAQQLQQASRNQHPAGQHIHGQTTTQHNLLLLQHSQRQHQQQQNQQQQHHSSHHQSNGSHSNASSGVIGGTCIGGATTTTIHSNARSLKGDATGGAGSATGTPGDGAPQATQTTPASATLATSQHTPITRLQQQQQQHHRPNALPITQPITKQPASATFKKDLPASMFHEEALDLHHIGGSASGGGTGSGTLGTPIGGILIGDGALNPITCPRCDRCRCEQCQSPRQLPQTWVCNKTCLCSAETIIDYASCLCCVKALFYHCARDHEMECDDGDSTLCVDDPCSCLPHKRTQRWGWLGALSLVLPCLWCYWPMRGCVAICEKCYARHAGHGCRCQTIGSTSSMLPIVNIGGGGAGGANAANGSTKSSGVSGGVHSGISGSGNNHHHHHHGPNSGGGGNTSESSAARILRKCDITPEKRLLDSSPEY